MPKLARRCTLAWLVVSSLLTITRRPAACTCGSSVYWPILLSATDDVPINAEVVLAVRGDASRKIFLREVDGGSTVAVSMTEQTMDLPGERSTAHVLTLRPEMELAPKTAYEVVFVRPEDRHTRYLVAGSITTAEAPDDRAPRLGAPQRVVAHVAGPYNSDRWLEIAIAPAEDDGRIAYLAWVAKANEPFREAPQWRFPGRAGDTQTIAHPACHSEHYPNAPGRYRLRIAAVDEAGNRSPAHVVSFRVP